MKAIYYCLNARSHSYRNKCENVEVAREYDRKKYATAIRNLKMFINKEISELDPKIETFKEIPGRMNIYPEIL